MLVNIFGQAKASQDCSTRLTKLCSEPLEPFVCSAYVSCFMKAKCIFNYFYYSQHLMMDLSRGQLHLLTSKIGWVHCKYLTPQQRRHAVITSLSILHSNKYSNQLPQMNPSLHLLIMNFLNNYCATWTFITLVRQWLWWKTHSEIYCLTTFAVIWERTAKSWAWLTTNYIFPMRLQKQIRSWNYAF